MKHNPTPREIVAHYQKDQETKQFHRKFAILKRYFLNASATSIILLLFGLLYLGFTGKLKDQNTSTPPQTLICNFEVKVVDPKTTNQNEDNKPNTTKPETITIETTKPIKKERK